jgi:hypothetical protein
LTLPLFKNIPVREERTKSKDLNYRRDQRKRWKELNPGRSKAIEKKWRKSHLEQFNRRQRKYNFKIKNEVFSRYSHGATQCACCSETNIEFLSIDHIGGGGCKHRKVVGSGINLYKWLKKNNYPEGFRVLCFNCNMSYGIYGYCPHQEIKKERMERSILNINLTSGFKEI